MHRTFFILAFTITLFFGATYAPVYAQQPPKTASSSNISTSYSQAILIASVNLQNGHIVSQKDNVFDISFDIANSNGIQSNVSYSVELISEAARGQVVVDQKVYGESLTLTENSRTHKTIQYTAPASLSGAYTLLLKSQNSSGFPLGILVLGKVTLTSQGGLELQPASCYLTVVGEKGSPRYTLLRGVDIAKDETLTLTCTAQNNSKNTVSATPQYQTHYRTLYGEVVAQTGGNSTPISFTAGENKTLILTLPKAAVPQAYSIAFTLQVGSISSNNVEIHYVLHGASASVQNLQLNKDYYQKGDVADVSFIWGPSADGSAESRLGTSSPSATSYSLTLTDGSGTACAVAQTDQKLTHSANPITHVPLTITNTCQNPHATLILKDSSGAVLAQQETILVSDNVPRAIVSRTIMYAIIVLIIVAYGITLYIKRRKILLTPTS